MSVAALLPRVRFLAVCDEAVASEIEEGVFTLEGVRQGFDAVSFPYTRPLWVYMVLFSPRGGSFDGHVRLVLDGVDKTLRYTKYSADFDNGADARVLTVDLGACTFSVPGVYSIEVRFWTESGDVLKGEHSLHVWQTEE